MAVVHRSKEGFILDHMLWIHRIYFSSSRDISHKQVEEHLHSDAAFDEVSEKTGVGSTSREKKKAQLSDDVVDSPQARIMQLFDIRTPFLMDGAAEKRAAALEEHGSKSLTVEVGRALHQQPAEGAEGGTSFPSTHEVPASKMLSKAGARRLRRKISRVNTKQVPLYENFERLNHSLEVSAQEEGASEVASVMEQFSALATLPEYSKIFKYSPTPLDFRSNNGLPRQAAARLLDDTARHVADEAPSVTSGCNAGDACTTVTDEEGGFIMPPRCSYYQTDVRHMTRALPNDLKFKVIVMDPPWWNKHVKRAKKSRGDHHGYEMMTVSELLDLPLRPLLVPDSVVLVWATNNRTTLRHFILQVQERWSLQVRQSIFWIKVTQEGIPVTSFQEGNAGKLPYERLFVLEPFEKLSLWSSSFCLCSEYSTCSSCEACNVKKSENNVLTMHTNPSENNLLSMHTHLPENNVPTTHTHPLENNVLTTYTHPLENNDLTTLSCRSRDREWHEAFEGCASGNKVVDVNRKANTKRKSCCLEAEHSEAGGVPGDSCHTAHTHVRARSNAADDEFFLLVSVPSALHSHKPPLNDVVRELGYAGSNDSCLELFARSLVPGWHSIGLEVLRLQRASLYDKGS
ncbi:MT-A70-like [Trinorchestia longiramus]|nr:MT-A70-like [Trinorchestia longiramus]